MQQQRRYVYVTEHTVQFESDGALISTSVHRGCGARESWRSILDAALAAAGPGVKLHEESRRRFAALLEQTGPNVTVAISLELDSPFDDGLRTSHVKLTRVEVLP